MLNVQAQCGGKHVIRVETTPERLRYRGYSWDEFDARCEKEDQERRKRRWWGPWRFEPTSLTLSYVDERKRCQYEIDLERMDTCAEMLAWIFHVTSIVKYKTWCSIEDA